LLDVIFNSPWKNYDDILAEPFKSQGFIKIGKKGLKTMITMAIQIMIESGDDWNLLREGIITLKADADINAKKGNLELKPDIGIKKLVLVSEDEEKETEQDAVKALVNLMLS